MHEGSPRPDVEWLREPVARVARQANLRLVVLFGSAARPGESPEDLDLAVRGDPPLASVELTNRFIRALGRQDVDLVDLRTADPVLLMQVASDGIPLFEREAGEFAAFWSLAARRFADTRKLREAERDYVREFIERRKLAT